MRVTSILEELDQALATVEVLDGRLRVRAVFEERPLSEATLALCRTHKQELLSYLAFAQNADHLLLASSRRLGQAWPQGCQLDEDERWVGAERELHEAYWSQDLSELEAILGRREQIALEIFAAFSKERAG